MQRSLIKWAIRLSKITLGMQAVRTQHYSAPLGTAGTVASRHEVAPTSGLGFVFGHLWCRACRHSTCNRCRQTRGSGSSCPDCSSESLTSSLISSAHQGSSQVSQQAPSQQPRLSTLLTSSCCSLHGRFCFPDSLPYSLSCFLASWIRYFTCSQTLSSGTAFWW